MPLNNYKTNKLFSKLLSAFSFKLKKNPDYACKGYIYLVCLYAFTSTNPTLNTVVYSCTSFLLWYCTQHKQECNLNTNCVKIWNLSGNNLNPEFIEGLFPLLGSLTRICFILLPSDRVYSDLTNDWREISLWWTEPQIFRRSCCFLSQR